MSKMSLRKSALDLIQELLREGIISYDDLFNLCGTSKFKKIAFFPRINYHTIAENLKREEVVFLSVDRKRAWYAKKRLESLLGRKVDSVLGTWGRDVGYFFTAR